MLEEIKKSAHRLKQFALGDPAWAEGWTKMISSGPFSLNDSEILWLILSSLYFNYFLTPVS